MWKVAVVTMDFVGRLCGSVPLKKEIVDGWLKARMPKEKPEDGKTMEEIKAEVLDTIEDIQEKVTLGFQGNREGFFIRGGTIKAHLKDCANQIKDIFKPEIRAFRSKVANKVYIDEYFVHLKTTEGIPIKKSDGEFDQPVHVMTAQGPRNALKTIQYLQNPQIKFTLRLLEDKEIKPETVEKIFEYGSIHGYGGERGMGEGRYTFQIEWQ